MTGEKKCTKCGIVKLLEEFYTNKLAKSGRQSQCKKCMRDTSREKTKIIKEFSEGETDIFKIGVLHGEGNLNDHLKTISGLKTTINALVDIITDADTRDAKLPEGLLRAHLSQ